MQDGAILGDVDALAGEHRRRALDKTGLLGQLDKQTDRLVGYAVLRVVQIEARTLGRETLATCAVHSEQLTQRSVSHLTLMGGQLTPGGAFGKGDASVSGRAHSPSLLCRPCA